MNNSTKRAIYKAATQADSALLELGCWVDDDEVRPGEARTLRSLTDRLADITNRLYELAEGRTGA